MNKKNRTSNLIKIALGAALMCVLAPISFPIGAVPVSLATLGVYIVAAIFGKYRATLSVIVYIVLGAVGLPVFSGFSGGISRLLWSGGGFIIGYIPCAFVTGLIIELLKDKKIAYPVGMLLGTVFCYLFGCLWYMFIMKTAFESALLVCVVPFVIFDAVKTAIASFASYSIKATVKRL